MRRWPGDRRIGLGAIGAALALSTLGCATPAARSPAAGSADAGRLVIDRILGASAQVVLENDGQRVRTGSGVIVGTRPAAEGRTHCFLLTAGHTVTGLREGTYVYVFYDRHREAPRKVRAEVLVQRDTRDLDLALLRFGPADCTPARSAAPPGLGDQVWTVGFPWGRDLRLARGVVSGVGRSPAQLMIDASVSYGASGGGVFDARTGRLLGLVEGYGTARISLGGSAPAAQYVDVPVPGETYVTPLAVIEPFLAESGYGELLGSESAGPRPGAGASALP